ncbi:hypothetical protein GGI10_000446 [Coemansia sp. RSA 2530]|nr:hypothetical protein GGI10_000446 [Coemansia sp. RSA 2530]
MSTKHNVRIYLFEDGELKTDYQDLALTSQATFNATAEKEKKALVLDSASCMFVTENTTFFSTAEEANNPPEGNFLIIYCSLDEETLAALDADIGEGSDLYEDRFP